MKGASGKTIPLPFLTAITTAPRSATPLLTSRTIPPIHDTSRLGCTRQTRDPSAEAECSGPPKDAPSSTQHSQASWNILRGKEEARTMQETRNKYCMHPATSQPPRTSRDKGVRWIYGVQGSPSPPIHASQSAHQCTPAHPSSYAYNSRVLSSTKA